MGVQTLVAVEMSNCYQSHLVPPSFFLSGYARTALGQYVNQFSQFVLELKNNPTQRSQLKQGW